MLFETLNGYAAMLFHNALYPDLKKTPSPLPKLLKCDSKGLNEQKLVISRNGRQVQNAKVY